MGYPTPLTGVARIVAENIITFSTPFTRENRLQFGARMTLIKTSDSTFSIYSTIPHSNAIVSSLDKFLQENGYLSSGETFEDKVTSIVIPDREHTMAIAGWHTALAKYNIKPSIIGPHKLVSGVEKYVTCQIPTSAAYTSLTGEDLVKFGLDSNDPLVKSNNFKFMYFPGHSNLEIVLLDQKAKTIAEGDMFFNFQLDNKKNPNSDVFNEQFHNKDPQHGMWGWLTKKVFTQDSWLSGKALNAIYKDKVGVRKGVDTMLSSWDFEKIIPCHGDTIDHNAKKVWKDAFEFLKK